VDWAVRKGRAALFADCGMGKTPMQLVWAQNVVERENAAVLVLAPLSVSQQTVEEAEKFGIEAVRAADGRFPDGARIITTNYEQLHKFDPADFAGVVCDESSIIKDFEGTRKSQITDFMRKVRYRLLCTATAAPNDYVELGTSSEALGHLGYMDMLSRFFKNDKDSLHPAFIGSDWRLKGHAERDFWRWLASWARACRKPSDLGFDDRHFVLPNLMQVEHVIESPVPFGEMFAVPARTLGEQREETRATIERRCTFAAERLSGDEPGVAWCHLNAEADLLEKMIPGAVQVSGSDSDDRKEEVFSAFRHGQISKLVTKPKIAAFGMNWQHCSRMTYFPTHSFEQYYQAVRRFWRFGQKNEVKVDAIITEAQSGTLENLKRKAEACDMMFSNLVRDMNDAIQIERVNAFTQAEEVPSWL
jgi:superfamily II DNA or RNA helicase